jgi:23S rRNA pseudouridine1911/1915/1917 synthase
MLVSRKGDWFEAVITEKQAGISLEAFLKEYWKMPKKLLHQFRMKKKVKVNNEIVNWNQLLQPNDRLQIQFYFSEENKLKPFYQELDLLYEDDHLLIINKPAGMDTHPNNPTDEHTLSNIVAFHFIMEGLPTSPRHIHRLDRDTSGAILFAKHPLAASLLDQMLEKREIKRTYIAIVDGIVKQNKGTINASIGRDRHHATRRRVSPSGQHAITNYRVVQRNQQLQQTLVELSLQTGRTHQIRVHMSHIGHPLVGDSLYGGSSSPFKQALHAIRLQLTHPFTEENIEVMAPAPSDIFKAYEQTILKEYYL